MPEKRDYYDVLGISKNSSAEDIKKAYRKMAKKYHPDVSKEENAEQKFKEVQEAYDVLSDSEKKNNYDQYGHQGNPFQGFGSGTSSFEGFGGGFGDIFSQFFGGQNTQRRHNGPQKGEDLERVMTIEFMDAVLGTKKDISVVVQDTCHTCGGNGAASKEDIFTCQNCKGKGHINVDQRTMFGTMRSQQVCRNCSGRGEIVKKRCTSCAGAGKLRQNKNVSVNIPAGIDDNMTLKVAGYGNGGTKGGPKGDLYLTFRIRPHKVFKRRNYDIHLEIPVSIADAVLGTKVDIPTIYGDVTLKIPSGTNHGTILRMSGQGIKHVQKNRKGDQLVIVKVETPNQINSEEKKLYEKLKNIESTKSKSSWQKFKNLFK